MLISLSDFHLIKGRNFGIIQSTKKIGTRPHNVNKSPYFIKQGQTVHRSGAIDIKAKQTLRQKKGQTENLQYNITMI